MRIAVVYDNGQIGSMFSQAKEYAIYDYEGTDVFSCTKTVMDTSDMSGNTAMLSMMLGLRVDAVICQRMDEEAYTALLSRGVIPVLGFAGSADVAADMLCEGTLPIFGSDEGGGCGGSCGSCGGGCGGCHSAPMIEGPNAGKACKVHYC